MTPEQYEAGKAELNELRTASNKLAEDIREGIEGARDINARVRVLQQHKRSTDSRANALQQSLKQHEQAEAARKAEEARAAREAEEKARQEAEEADKAETE